MEGERLRGDRYAEPRFSVPASAGKMETCTRVGHAFADKRGRCVRCGAKIRDAWGDAKDEMKHEERPA